jgi:breast cancer 2 susceptibility protein
MPSMKDGSTFAEAFARGNMISDVNECFRFAVSSVTLQVNSENAFRVRFDSVTYLPDSFFDLESTQHAHTLGSVGDYRRALLELGCPSSMISEKWIKTHVRWINWKLASIERRFAQFLGGHYFTFPAVVGQLKHRYERELRDGARPILRRVLNRDAPASCMMILCVARVQNVSVPENESSISADDIIATSRYLLELTDGWYSMPAAPDTEICDRIANGGIRIGTKLLVSSSAMTGFDDGVDPLDDCFDPARPSCSPVLNLAANSTRIARWDAKLGRVSTSPAGQDGLLIVKRLADVKERGGPLPLFDMRVLQRYPLMFLEKSARPGGSKSRVLSEQDESARLEKYEKQRLATIEGVYEEIEAECEAVGCSCCLVFQLGRIELTVYSC